jgi:hypothetical protein
MARTFHTPVPVWLEMTLVEFYRWVMTAEEMLSEEQSRRNVQEVGPGL